MSARKCVAMSPPVAAVADSMISIEVGVTIAGSGL